MNERANYQRVKELFLAAIEMAPAERSRFLDRSTAGDRAVRAEVEAMLESQAGAALPDPTEMAAIAARSATPQTIGRYRILDVLGRGGMGVVYRAEQQDPRRTVALKVVRPDALSPAVLRRFEHEAELLGRLQHPGIAQIFEASPVGVETHAQPWFAMEFVEGEILTDFVERQQLSPADIVGLVASIADAVEHAHQKGVIHRDLKPANILVDASGQPKILDFGIGRALDDQRLGEDAHTQVGQVLGTLAYMSPEQALGQTDDIDSRADVYSLGVIAYRLLAGRLPIDVDDLNPLEATRRIAEKAPAPLGREQRALRGDVSTVVMKALAKDTERRYSGASAFAADLRRCLRHEPVTARPPSAIYTLSKMAARHRGLTAGVAIATLALIAVALISLDKARRETALAGAAEAAKLDAERERDEAGRSRDDAEAVVDLMLSAIAAARPLEVGKDVTVRNLLVPLATDAGIKFRDAPRIEGRLRQTIGMTYWALGDFAEAEQHVQAAVDIFEVELGHDHEYTVAAEVDLASVRASIGNLEGVEATLHGLRHRIARLRDGGPLMLHVVRDLMKIQLLRREQEGAETLAAEAVELAGRVHDPGDANVFLIRASSAQIPLEFGDAAEAERLTREVVIDCRRTLGAENGVTLEIEALLARCMARGGKADQAAELLTSCLARSRIVNSDRHPTTMQILADLGGLRTELGQFETAAPLMTELVDLQAACMAEDHVDRVTTQLNLGAMLVGLGQEQEAERHYRAVLTAAEEREALRWIQGLAWTKYGALLLHTGREIQAEPMLLKAHRNVSEEFGANSPYTRMVLINLVKVYERLGQPEKAGKWRMALEAFGG